MSIQYIPILRWKRGERIGLSRLTNSAKSETFPVFILGTDQFKPKAATRSQSAVPAPDVFVQQLAACWGSDRFGLDFSMLPDGATTHPLTQIAASSRAALNLVPVTNFAASRQYQASVASVIQTDGRGVGLRIDLNEAGSIANWIGQWPHSASDTDLIIDFGNQVGPVAALGLALNNVFLNLHFGAQWRTVTVAGTSMPENFGGFLAGLHQIPRVEFTLWQQLHNLRSLPYQIGYGDYASVSPGTPPAGIAWGYPINARYSLPDTFFDLPWRQNGRSFRR